MHRQIKIQATLLIAILVLSANIASAQTVRFVGKKLQVNNQPFLIKGINESQGPIKTFAGEWGICYYDSTLPNPFVCPFAGFPAPRPTATDLDFLVGTELAWTAVLNANTYRIFDKLKFWPAPILQRANQYGVKIMAGYWIPHNSDFNFTGPTDPRRVGMITDFVTYINTLKADPNYSAVLMIGLSNENNMHWCEWANQPHVCVACDENVQASGFYNLVNDMAGQAKLGDPDPRPIIIVSGNLGDIGNATRQANDASLPSIDGWGVNSYQGSTFNTLFADFALRSQKPLVITEYGMDAWNEDPIPGALTGHPDENIQQLWLGLLTDEIKANYQLTNNVVAGGVVFQLADGWNKSNGDLWTRGVTQHNPGGWINDAFPDKKADEEFWGLFDRQPSPTTFLDTYVPRQAAFTLRTKYQ